MQYEGMIRHAKSSIASAEDRIIREEQVLGGRGESSTIRYY